MDFDAGLPSEEIEEHPDALGRGENLVDEGEQPLKGAFRNPHFVAHLEFGGDLTQGL